MIAALVAVVLQTSPEGAYFAAWYPNAFADLAPASNEERTLRAAAMSAHQGRVSEARRRLADFTSGASPEWALVGELSRRRLERLMARGLDYEKPTNCLECEFAFLRSCEAELELKPLFDTLAQVSIERQPRLNQLMWLVQTLNALEESRSKEQLAQLQPNLFAHAAQLADVDEAQLVVAHAIAKQTTRVGIGDGTAVLLRGAEGLKGCARAATLDLAAHLEQRWFGHMLTLGRSLEDGRLLSGQWRQTGMDYPFPPAFEAPPPMARLLDQSKAALAQCNAPWARVEEALHPAVQATRAGRSADALWLTVVAVAQKHDELRVADFAALHHALLGLNSEVIKLRLTALVERDDRAAFFSAVELTLLWADLAAGSEPFVAEVLWGALDATFEHVRATWSWDATQAEVAARSAELALNKLHHPGRAISDGERALRAALGAVEESDKLSALRAIPGYIKTVQDVVRSNVALTLQKLLAAYGLGESLGLIAAPRALARRQELVALSGKLNAPLAPLPAGSAYSPANVLKQKIFARLRPAANCERWRAVEAEFGRELRAPDELGMPALLGLALDLDAELAHCSEENRGAALKRLRASSALRATRALPATLGPIDVLKHRPRAEAMVRHALTLGDEEAGRKWLAVVSDIAGRSGSPGSELGLKVLVEAATGHWEAAERLLAPVPFYEASFLELRLEIASARGDATAALMAFDAIQAATRAQAERFSGVDRRNPFSAEKTALENRLAREGTLSALELKRLTELRAVTRVVKVPPPLRWNTAAEVQSWLDQFPTAATLLAFHRLGSNVVAFRVERARVSVHRLKLSRALLDAVLELERDARADAVDAADPAEVVWAALLAPLGEVSDDREVFITATPQVAGVLFEALHGPGAQPLALRVPVTRLLSMRGLSADRAGRTGVLAYGLVNGGLDQAVTEAQSVAHLLGGSALPAESTRERLLEAVAGARWVHLATHGKLDFTNRLASEVTLSGGTALRVFDFLAVASGVDGVFFSACDTSVAGFSEIAHVGGARVAVSTPWPIWDRRAERMVSAFYAALGANQAQWVERSARAMLAARRAGVDAATPPEVAATAFLISASSLDAVRVEATQRLKD